MLFCVWKRGRGRVDAEWGVCIDAFKVYFEKFGALSDAIVLLDPVTGRSRFSFLFSSGFRVGVFVFRCFLNVDKRVWLCDV